MAKPSKSYSEPPTVMIERSVAEASEVSRSLEFDSPENRIF